MKKLLDFTGEPKSGPRRSEDVQGENKWQGKGKNKDKGKEKTSKDSEYSSKEMESVKEKNPISCWIFSKEHYVNNYPLK